MDTSWLNHGEELGSGSALPHDPYVQRGAMISLLVYLIGLISTILVLIAAKKIYKHNKSVSTQIAKSWDPPKEIKKKLQ